LSWSVVGESLRLSFFNNLEEVVKFIGSA